MNGTMKKWSTLFITAVLFMGTAVAQNQEVIFKGNAGSTKYDGYVVTLYRYDMADKELRVEGKIKDGKFEIKAPYNGPGQYLFQNGYELKAKGGYAPYAILVDKAGTVTINANMEALYKSSTSGSSAQSVKEEFDKTVEKKKKPFRDGLRKKYGAAMVDNPEAHMNSPKFQEFAKEWQDFEEVEGPKIETALLLGFAKRYPNSMAIAKLADDPSLDVDTQEKIYSLLSPENQSSRYGQKVVQVVQVTRKSSAGTKIPDFFLPKADGTPVSLKQMLQGKKYLFVDFWASWCGPCRAEFPGMKALYSQYKDKGFEVWGISTDSSKENWLSAIKQEDPTWPQVWEGGTPKEQKASGNLFYVPYLPSTYLLDAEGKILARDLRGEALEKKLKELFN